MGRVSAAGYRVGDGYLRCEYPSPEISLVFSIPWSLMFCCYVKYWVNRCSSIYYDRKTMPSIITATVHDMIPATRFLLIKKQ